MSKRAPLDLHQFKIELPKPARDPLETIIPTAPVASTTTPPRKDPKDTLPPSVRGTQPAIKKKKIAPEKERKHDSKLSRYHAITLASYHDSIIELIRKAVKTVGKDPFFGRFTPEEKGALADIAHTYKRNGIRTSENEIARIAVNFLVQDYEENKENSFVDRVLKALNT